MTVGILTPTVHVNIADLSTDIYLGLYYFLKYADPADTNSKL